MAGKMELLTDEELEILGSGDPVKIKTMLDDLKTDLE